MDSEQAENLVRKQRLLAAFQNALEAIRMYFKHIFWMEISINIFFNVPNSFLPDRIGNIPMNQPTNPISSWEIISTMKITWLVLRFESTHMIQHIFLKFFISFDILSMHIILMSRFYLLQCLYLLLLTFFYRNFILNWIFQTIKSIIYEKNSVFRTAWKTKTLFWRDLIKP